MPTKKRQPTIISATFDSIISGGQSIGTMNGEEKGKKIMAWGVLPGETANIRLTKNKSNYAQGIIANPVAQNLITINPKLRVEPKDSDSYLSTSPWQIMDFTQEQFFKSALIEEAFELQKIVLPDPITTWADDQQYFYRNKIEYSFWYDTETEQLSLAFFQRGSHNKVAIKSTSLALPAISELAKEILQILNHHKIGGRDLKTLLIRASQNANTSWQLYVKNEEVASAALKNDLNNLANGEIIFSNPKSPASVVTKKLWQTKQYQQLSDKIKHKRFSYKTEGFFQINLPVYEKALKDIADFITPETPVLDMYSGVGTIGLTVADKNPLTLIEISEIAVKEMTENIKNLGLQKTAKAVLTPSEQAIDYIKHDQIVIVDPPRAGVHPEVIEKLIDVKPEKIIYLSCNPITQARDIAPLLNDYRITFHIGYNFFPRTPHIEHLVVLERIK